MELSIRSYAHLGDAVYEVFAREKTIRLTQNAKLIHRLTVAVVNAEFQAYLLDYLVDFINEDESDIVRRARNLQVTTARRTNQKLHRLSTAFEALIGYLNNTDRLKELFSFIDTEVDKKLEEIMQKEKDSKF